MSNKNSKKMGTKAETLSNLSKLGYSIPKFYFFTVEDWKSSKDIILDKIKKTFTKNIKVAVRSSSINEDTENTSMAGAFDSFLNIKVENLELCNIKVEELSEKFNNSISDYF